MTQHELITQFPPQNSIADRVLLIGPDIIRQLIGMSVKECRIFLVVIKGSLSVKIGSDMIRVDANNMLDILIWEPICFVEMSDDIDAWALLQNYLFTNESLNDLKPANSETFKNRHSIPIIPVTDKDLSIIVTLLKMMATTLNDTDHFYRTELCQTYFRSFILELGNMMLSKGQAVEDSEGVITRQDMLIMGFLKLVWRYYKEKHNIDFYSARLCISSKHLSRVIKAKIGKTPYAVIRDELLQQAVFLLKDTKMPIQDIAAELHFSEMAAFCKFFKKNKGMSPSAFRASQQKIIGSY